MYATRRRFINLDLQGGGGAPQYSARLSNWNLEPNLSDSHYEFEPPNDANEIDFLPIPMDLPPEETEAKE